jgi:hypothetical protein
MIFEFHLAPQYTSNLRGTKEVGLHNPGLEIAGREGRLAPASKSMIAKLEYSAS